MTRRMAAEDGVPTAAMVEYYRRRAAGEVGLIISEGVSIDGLHAYDTLTVPRMETAEQISAWKEVVDAVHAEGGAFAPQLWHTGRRAVSPIAPMAESGRTRSNGDPLPDIRAMESADFEQVLAAYVHCAKASEEIGCDAIEVHGAHGYLLDTFLIPATNEREDEYGGSREARMRFPLEIVRAVREAVSPDMPILYRFSQWSMDDYRQIKWHGPEDLERWVQALKAAGVDVLHVSTRDACQAGFPDHDPSLSLAGWAQRLSGLPTVAVGKVSVTLAMDESYGPAPSQVLDPGPYLDLVEQGEVDLLAVGRALIANPDWVPGGSRGGMGAFEALSQGLASCLGLIPNLELVRFGLPNPSGKTMQSKVSWQRRSTAWVADRDTITKLGRSPVRTLNTDDIVTSVDATISALILHGIIRQRVHRFSGIRSRFGIKTRFRQKSRKVP